MGWGQSVAINCVFGCCEPFDIFIFCGTMHLSNLHFVELKMMKKMNYYNEGKIVPQVLVKKIQVGIMAFK